MSENQLIFGLERELPTLEQLDHGEQVQVLQEAAYFKRQYPALEQGHQTYIACRSILDRVLDHLGLPRDVSLHLYHNPEHPDVHISPYAQELRVSDTFIDVMDGDPDLIEAVFAHEIGHLALCNYWTGSARSQGSSVDNVTLILRNIQAFEDEYQADRISAMTLSHGGNDPLLMATALERLEDFYEKKRKKGLSIRHRTLDRVDAYDSAWFVNTHPHTRRRINAIRRLSRNLPSKPKTNKEPVPPFVGDERDDSSYADERMLHGMFEENVDYWEGNELYETDYGYTRFAERREVPDSDEMLDFSWSEIDDDPDKVNEYKPEDESKIQHWWDQAIPLIRTKDGFSDFLDDIGAYSSETIRTLLFHFPAHRYLTELNKDEPYMLAVGFNLYASNVQVAASVLGNTLIERGGFTEDVIRVFLEDLQRYRIENGDILPYIPTPVLSWIRDQFEVGSDERRAELVSFARRYELELSAGYRHFDAAKHYLRDMEQWIEADSARGKTILYSYRWSATDSAEEQIMRDAIKRVESDAHLNLPRNYRSPSMMRKLLDLDLGITSKNVFERLRERKPENAIELMSNEEFEDEFFGSGRERHPEMSYTVLERGNSFLSATFQLWKGSEGYSRYKTHQPGVEKLALLLENLRVSCSRRDQVIVKALGWEPLKNLDDITDIQAKIEEEDDVEILAHLSRSFYHPILQLASSQRLMEITPDDVTGVKLPEYIEDDLEIAFAEFPSSVRDNKKLRKILTCFPGPSPLRDEYVEEFVDDSESADDMLAYASLLSNPPPAIARPRKEKYVATTESALDAMERLDTLEKEEIMLYLIGHREFYSGIDAKFSGTTVAQANEINAKRRLVLYHGKGVLKNLPSAENLPTDFRFSPDALYHFYLKLIQGVHDDEVEYASAHGDISPADQDFVDDGKYLTTTPDAIILASKQSGMPIDLLFHQQRTTTTREEQIDLLETIFTGKRGIFKGEYSDEFVSAASRTLVYKGQFAEEYDSERKQSIADFLEIALRTCPSHKLPDMFLNMWYMNDDDQSLPDIFASLMQKYSPVTIKAGQYLSTQTTSLPEEWTQAFRNLCDQNASADKTIFQDVVSREYPGVFKRIGRKIGEGSIAAVYEAELITGKRVAIKAIHPYIEQEIEDDIEFLDEMVHFVNTHQEVYGVVLPENLADVTREQLRREISTDVEAENNRTLSSILAEQTNGVGFSVPQPVKGMTRKGLLVLDYVDGISLDSTEHLLSAGFDPVQLRKAVGLELLRQIGIEGVYQADANQGNFRALYQEGKPHVSWIDTGHLGYLSVQDRTHLQSLMDEEQRSTTLSSMLNATPEQQRTAVPIIEDWLASQPDPDALTGLEKTFHSYLDLCFSQGWVLNEQWVTLMRSTGLMKPFLEELDADEIQAHLVTSYLGSL